MANNNQINQCIGTGQQPRSTNDKNYSLRSAIANVTNQINNSNKNWFKDSTKNVGLNTDLNRNNNSQTLSEQVSWFRQIGNKIDSLFTYLKKNTDSYNKITENVLKDISNKLKNIDDKLTEANRKNTNNNEQFDSSNIDRFVKQFDPNVLKSINDNMRLINTKLQLFQDKLLNNSVENNASNLTPELQNFLTNYLNSINDNQTKILASVNQSITAITDQSNALKEYIDKGWTSLDFSNLENKFMPKFDVLDSIDDKLSQFIESYKSQNQITDQKLDNISAAASSMTSDKNSKTDELLTSINNYIQNNIKSENISSNINTNIQNNLNDYNEKIKSYYESNSNNFQQEFRQKLELINSNINSNVGNIIQSINNLNSRISETAPKTTAITPAQTQIAQNAPVAASVYNTNNQQTITLPAVQSQLVTINRTQNLNQPSVITNPIAAIQQRVNRQSEMDNRSNYFSIPSLDALNNEERKNNVEIVRGLAIPKTISAINPETGTLKNMTQFQLETIRHLQEVNANIRSIKNSIINHFESIERENYRRALNERF